MKKLCIVLLLVSSISAYSQIDSAGIPDRQVKKNIISLDAGTVVATLGILQGVIINGGYETLIIPNFGAEISFNAWLMNIVSIGMTGSFYFHILGDYPVDPYIGVGFSYMRFIGTNIASIDIPLTAGINCFITDFFGIKMQGKLYLLSISMAATEIDIGMFFAYHM